MKGSNIKNGQRVDGKFQWIGGSYIGGTSIYGLPKYLNDGDDFKGTKKHSFKQIADYIDKSEFKIGSSIFSV